MTSGATSVTTRRPRVTARAVAVVAAAVLAVPLSACSYWAPNVTQVVYNAGDGLNAEVEDVWVRNMLVIGQAEDGTAVLNAVFFNQTGDDLDITLTSDVAGLDTTLTVPARGRLTLTAPQFAGTAEDDTAEAGAGLGDDVEPTPPTPEAVEVVLLEPLGVPRGSTVPISITTPAHGEFTLQPPVLLPTATYTGWLDEVPDAQGSGPPLDELLDRDTEKQGEVTGADPIEEGGQQGGEEVGADTGG